MANFKPISTCLSLEVHHMVCNLGLGNIDVPDIEHIVTESGEVCWEAITFHLCTSGAEEQDLDYIESVKLLGPICKTVHLYLLSLSTRQFDDQYGLWFEWTNNRELFVEIFEAIKSSEETAVALSLMKLTASLERVLGDVFLMIGKECPFLLRNLLASQELATVFGQRVMNVLRVFLGSPQSLNLRNILWHGFAAPAEIPSMYTSMLLFLTAGLGQILEGVLPQRDLTLLHRPYFKLTQLEELTVFPDVNEEAIAVAEDFIRKSDFVVEIMLPYWTEALAAYRNQRYADCVILLLPQLEMGLRKYFTTVNNCPNRLLTAEVIRSILDQQGACIRQVVRGQLLDVDSPPHCTPRLMRSLPLWHLAMCSLAAMSLHYISKCSVLVCHILHYITVMLKTPEHRFEEEMLAKYLDNGVKNQLPLALGDPIMEILWDLLNHQEGPRLRDHLSHGELDLKAFPREMASHVVVLAVVLLHHCCRGDTRDATEDNCLRTIVSSMRSYCSRFHPIGRLKQQLRHCAESLQKWSEMSRPTLEQTPKRSGSDRSNLTDCLLKELVSNLINRLQVVYDRELNPSQYLSVERQLHLVTELLANHMCTLYSPRAVLEVVSLLRKMTSQCLTVSEQITSGAASRHQQWLNKSLRSRQRQNYLRMLDSVQYLHHVFSLLILLITVELLNVQTMSDKDSSECHCYLKFLKSLLRYTENMVTYTSSEKNKWDESWDLTEKMLLKVKNFYNRCHKVTTDCAT